MNDIPTEAMTTELNDIIVGCEADMLKNYPQVITAFKTCYNLPELDPVRHEISLCLIFGLYQAAITLTNHLLESMLKYGLTYHHAINNRPVNPAQSAAVVKQLVDWLG